MITITINFDSDLVAQDLLMVLSKELNLSIVDTILHSVNLHCYNKII